jgi:hypothetical protein
MDNKNKKTDALAWIILIILSFFILKNIFLNLLTYDNIKNAPDNYISTQKIK